MSDNQDNWGDLHVYSGGFERFLGGLIVESDSESDISNNSTSSSSSSSSIISTKSVDNLFEESVVETAVHELQDENVPEIVEKNVEDTVEATILKEPIDFSIDDVKSEASDISHTSEMSNVSKASQVSQASRDSKISQVSKASKASRVSKSSKASNVNKDNQKNKDNELDQSNDIDIGESEYMIVPNTNDVHERPDNLAIEIPKEISDTPNTDDEVIGGNVEFGQALSSYMQNL